MTPQAIGWGWTADDTSPLSLSIRYLTRPGWAPRPLARWSHMVLVFAFEDTEFNCLHEALGSGGWCARPIRELAEWHSRNPAKRHLAIEWLDELTPEAVEAIHAESCNWLGTRSYAYRQLAQFAVAETLAGRALRRLAPGLFNRDVADDEVICSEGACRLVGERWPALDLRRKGEPWAMISPQAAWERFEERERLNAEYRTANRQADEFHAVTGLRL